MISLLLLVAVVMGFGYSAFRSFQAGNRDDNPAHIYCGFALVGFGLVFCFLLIGGLLKELGF